LFTLIGSQELNYQNLYRAFSNYCNTVSGPINLCGLSLGGVLALNYAMDYPEKVQSLVIIAAQYKISKMLMKTQNIIFRFMPETAFKSMGLPKKHAIQLTNSMINLDLSNKIKSISCNALIICGGKDNVNKKAAKDLADSIPGARLRIVENAGHEVNKENPKELASVINMFYDT